MNFSDVKRFDSVFSMKIRIIQIRDTETEEGVNIDSDYGQNPGLKKIY